MERFSNRKIDELGRIMLHGELRKKLGLTAGANVTLTAVDSIVIMQCTDDGGIKVCELGRITIPVEIQNRLGWGAGSEVAVYHTDSLLILKTP